MMDREEEEEENLRDEGETLARGFGGEDVEEPLKNHLSFSYVYIDDAWLELLS